MPRTSPREGKHKATRLSGSLESFLDQVARPGCWLGGGSVAAMSTALAAALFEKLQVSSAMARKCLCIRRECADLVRQDAEAFAEVIHQTRQKDRVKIRRALQVATELQWKVLQHARWVERACHKSGRKLKPRLESDLRCARALAKASSEAARGFILANVAWADDPRYRRRMQQRLRRQRFR